jgi:hypothetical protein
LNQQIREKLESLSRDFAVLAPSQVQQEQWKDLLGDPNSFAYELLGHAHSGLSLAQSLHNFLSVCLKEMDAKVFVQPIDDIDSAIEQGWPILETLRKYLATPYLITILSGHMSLYRLLVRKQQVDKLKSLIELGKVIENEPNIERRTTRIINEVSQLTDQYLAKIIPPYLHIKLTSLHIQIMDEAERGEELVTLQYNLSSEEGKKIEKSLSKVYADFSEYLFGIPQPTNPIDTLKRRSWLPLPLLPSTTRNMLRFLKVIQPWAVDNDKLDKGAAIEALAYVFNNSLYNGHIYTGDLLALKSGRHLEWLAGYCLDRQQQFPEFWTLESRYNEEELNHQVLLLQAFLFQAWKTRTREGKSLLYPNGPMSYAIKVCFPCWIASRYQLVENKLTTMKGSLNVSITKRHVYLAVDGLIYYILSSAIKQNNNWPDHDIGIAKISKINFEELYKQYVKENSTKKDDIEKHENEISFVRKWFTFDVVHPNAGAFSCVSILIGFARLADVLTEGPEEEGQLKRFLLLLMEHHLWQILPSTDSEVQPKTDITHEEGFQETEIELSEDSRLIKYLVAWIKEMRGLKEEKLVPPLVISRTFIRFTRNLESIDNDDFLESKSLGEILGFWIAALLNSLLIEEVIFKKAILDADLKLSHLTKDMGFFKQNLDKYTSDNNDKKISYTLAVLKCPLFLMFLKRDLKPEIYNKIADEENKKENYGEFLETLSGILFLEKYPEPSSQT